MNERAFQWAKLLVQHRPQMLQARRLFSWELLRAAQAESGGSVVCLCRNLQISRNTFHYAQRAWNGQLQLSGPQSEAIRQMARELVSTPGGYRAAQQLFSEMVAMAALEAARQRRSAQRGSMVADVTNAASLLRMHRNSIYRITRRTKGASL